MAIDSKNLLVAIKAYSRANPLPLDASEIHDSLEAAQAYAASAKAYAGQTIKVLQNGIYETYVLNPAKEGLGLTLNKINVDESQLKNYVQVVEELPTSGQEQGVIYIDSKLTGQIWTGSEWKVIFEQIQIEGEEDWNYSPQEAFDIVFNTVGEVQNRLSVLEGNESVEGSVDYKIAQALVNFEALKRKIVTELPQENIDNNTIYMIHNGSNEGDVYDEYMYINNNWEVLGSTKVDLTDYYTKSEVYSKSETDSAFATLAALANYALKSDIPAVPTKVSELENDLGYLTEHQDLSNYALKSEIPDTSDFAKKNDLQNYVTQGTYQSAIDSLNQQNSALAAMIGNAATKTELESYAKLTDIPSLDNYTTKDYVTDYVTEAINNAKLEGGDGQDIDLSIYAKLSDLGNYSGFDTVVDYVNAAVSTASVRVVEF